MKWWGWGRDDFRYPMEEKPALWPFIRRILGIEADVAPTPPVPRSAIRLPSPGIDPDFAAAVAAALGAEHVTSDEDERLRHAYGKSYPDLLRVRRGEVLRAPDLIVFPGCHDEVEIVVREAHARGVVLVPFGGGTNIVGGVNPEADDRRSVVSLDLRRMNRLLTHDRESMTATFEAGVLGPELEQALGELDLALGHHPDSFQFSTLGGWLATRSAGMQSDAYGKIEDMVVSLKMVAPVGTVVTKTVPRAATGPDLNQLAVGSEGTLGVITEATMRVHPRPGLVAHHGILFRSFAAGVEAAHAVLRAGDRPSLLRLSDEGETELSFNTKRPATGMKRRVQAAVKRLVLARGYDRPALMIVGFEGDPAVVRRRRRATLARLRALGGFHLGRGVGSAWAEAKYDLPYLRDWVMDWGVVVDVAETAAVWSRVMPLYERAIRTVRERVASLGRTPYLGCHLSHSYETGACLYFTWAFVGTPGEELEQYHLVKRAITSSFVASGGALSHHHAIGVEHRPWMADELGPVGVKALRGLKGALDGDGILNPGKLLPDGE